MKNIFPVTLLLVATLYFSCDKVTVDPYSPPPIVIPTTDTVRKVLVEDITGHTCTNCPDAASMIDTLEHYYPERIIPVAVHMTTFAEPCPSAMNPLPGGAPVGSYTEDLRAIGEDAAYDAAFGCNSWPPPQGMINRKGYPALIPTGVSAWPSTVSTILSEPMTAYLKITPSYNTTTRDLNVHVSGKMMCDTTGTYNLCLYLVEDSIIGWQLVHGVNDSDYVFNHVLRGCMNTPGTIGGDQLFTGTVTNGTLINYDMATAFHVSSTYNAAHCKVVAYIYKTSDYGVLQAAQAKIE